MRIVRYLMGFVRIRISGTQPEKFINICIRRSIPVWDLVRLEDGSFELSMPRSLYRKHARSIGRKSGCRTRVLCRRGLWNTVRRLKHRKALLITVVLVCALTCFLNSLVWSVEILPGERVTQSDVLRTEQLLLQAGVQPGILLDTVDLRQVSALLLAAQKDLCWVHVRRTGTKLYVEIERGISYNETQQIPEEEPCNIVAEKDCEILKCTVYAGQKVCTMGQVVHRGEVLVSGEEAGVHAQADIMGKTWYQVRIEVENEVDFLQETGNHEVSRSLFLFGLQIPLPGASWVPWHKPLQAESISQTTVLQYWMLPGNVRLPVGMRTTTKTETMLEHCILSDEEALPYARLQAADLLDEKIPDHASVLSTTWRVYENEEGMRFLEVTAECAEPIGVEQEIRSR